MNSYEGIFILKADLNEEDLKGLVTLISEEIKKAGGTLGEVKSWGRRNLAYSIKKFTEAVYYEIHFEIAPAALKDIDRKFRLTDNILRFMIIKKEA